MKTLKEKLGNVAWARISLDDSYKESVSNYTSILSKIISGNDTNFVSSRIIGSADPLGYIDTNINRRERDIKYSLAKVSIYTDIMLKAIIDSVVQNTTVSNLGASYYVDIVKNAQRNVTINVGGGYSLGMDKFFLYTAAQIFFRPIDKNLPLWNTNKNFSNFIGTHFSLLAGITLTSVDKANERTGITGNKGLVLGGGFRLLPWLNFSGGTLIYNLKDSNPLTSKTTVWFTPFAALSIDIDVKKLFSAIPITNDALFK